MICLHERICDHLPALCVCGASWSALLSSPFSGAASPAPSEVLFCPVQIRCPPPASSARPAPCNMRAHVMKPTLFTKRSLLADLKYINSHVHEPQLLLKRSQQLWQILPTSIRGWGFTVWMAAATCVGAVCASRKDAAVAELWLVLLQERQNWLDVCSDWVAAAYRLEVRLESVEGNVREHFLNY